MVKRWLLAIVGRAPMGAGEVLVLIVTSGAVILGALPGQPKPTDPLAMWVLWWVVITGAAALLVRSTVGLIAVGLTLVAEGRRSLRRFRHRSIPGMAGALTVTVIPGPPSPTLPQHSFATSGRQDEPHELGHRPQALEFSKPEKRVVRHADIPCRIRCGDGWLVVKNFYATGVVIDEDGTFGDAVGFVSYAATPEPPTFKPVEPAPWAGQFASATGGVFEASDPILPPRPLSDLKELIGEVAAYRATSTDDAAWRTEPIYYRNSARELIARARVLVGAELDAELAPLPDSDMTTPKELYLAQMRRVQTILERVLTDNEKPAVPRS